MYRPVAPPGGVPEGRGKEGKDRAREGGAALEGGMALTSLDPEPRGPRSQS